jgi:L-alanine-DL-glutamate epimerase-like enolase superfamily enzyme
MRITDIEVITLRVPQQKSLGLSNNREINHRGASFVIIRTDEGVQGIGEGYVPEPSIFKIIIERQLKSMLIGQNPLAIERLWRKMMMNSVYWEQKGQYVSAVSGVDVALWDIAGKYYNIPVYQLLGGDVHRDGKVKAYASDLYWDTPEKMVQLAQKYTSLGFSALKTHLGRGLIEDEKRVKLLKETIGETELIVDVNCGYSRVDALKVGRMLEKYGVYWYEEPLAPYDIEGYAYLKRKLDIPIATGENEYTKWGFKELFLKNAVDFAMPDVIRCGGITETKKICALAEAFDVICTPHNFATGVGLAATLQVMACTPICQWLEFDTTEYTLYETLLKNPLEIDRKGMVTIPVEPGIGVELKKDIIEEYSIQ